MTNATGEITQTGTKTPGSNPGGAMVYSLQLNTGLASAFSSTLCSKPTGWVQGQALCIEWVQFVFTNNATSPGGHVGTSSAVEYVLWNYLNNHNKCPTGWTSTTGSAGCYNGSPSSVMPVENLPNGTSITVVGIVGSQNDTIEVLDGGTLYATVVSRPFQLPFWYQTQFNIFGDSGGAVAIFPPGATMLVTTNVPGLSTCVQNSLTAESANLGAASNCVVSAATGGGTAMTFAEGVPPLLNSVSPRNLPFSGGPIQIQGVGFAPRAAIWIGGRTAPAVCDTSTHCTATIPSFPASTSRLNVYVANKTPSGAYLGPYSASSANGRISFFTPLSCEIKGEGCSGSDGKYLFSVACPVVSDVSVDGVPLGTGLSFVGEGHLGSTNVVACAHGVPNNCHVYPTPTGGGVCHVSPPPPVKSCLVCRANGQQCVPNASGGGYRCVGTVR